MRLYKGNVLEIEDIDGKVAQPAHYSTSALPNQRIAQPAHQLPNPNPAHRVSCRCGVSAAPRPPM